jgi:hypothetical protein
MRMKGMSSWLAPVLPLGCAFHPALGRVPAGTSMSIQVGSNLIAPNAVDFRNTAIGGGRSTGAGTGAAAGGRWGLACGPLAFRCVPIGAVTIGSTGMAAGAAVAATGMLQCVQVDTTPDEQLHFVIRVLLSVQVSTHGSNASDASQQIAAQIAAPIIADLSPR